MRATCCIVHVFLILAVSLTTAVMNVSAESQYPHKAIHIVVYTDPGGLIDVTARRIAALIEEHVDQAVVVENKKGGGGLVALNHVLRRPADGYTIFGLTSSVISKVVAAHQSNRLNDLHMLARVVSDYECLISRQNSGINSIPSLVSASKEKKLRWVGPAFGGTDHLFAMQTWQALGIEAAWIPYRSGNQALAALLGGHGDVYVGNPQDISGQPDLQLFAIASEERLGKYPTVPTFKELGYTELAEEVLWRGFAVRQGTPPAIISAIEKMLKQATQSKQWQQFISTGEMLSTFDTGDSFKTIVAQQIEKDKKHLNIQ